ncbi:GAF domain-containing SpoIIE family protein phosphatase [Nostoc sp.]|uniref:PP2C family protein-serine/threonine phosphatase n=1 Tax=Nostoc sp. TaxID=1180 RepID=UPI002FF0B1B0
MIQQSYEENGIAEKHQQLIEELKSLRREVAELKTEKAAFQAQKKLLEHSVATIIRASPEEEMLKATLQDTLDVCSQLTGAQKGSLFLLDRQGAVTDSILTQRETVLAERDRLIGCVLAQGLAGWVYRQRQVGLIVDTETDDRWLQLPNQPYAVRSALAVPILRNEEVLGILTLLHQEPGHFSPEIAHLMQLTADQIAIVLENAQLYGKIETYSKALNYELEKGRQIQRDFLPNEIPQLPNLEIATFFSPARQVAGDFYDVFMLPGDYLGLVIADVADKGVGAALFMALFRSLIRIFSGQISLGGLSIIANEAELSILLESEMATNLYQINPLKAVALTNNYIAQQHAQMSMFATLFFGVLDPATGILTYINGGHETLFIVGDTGIKASLNSTGPAVGMMPNMKFKIQQVQLELGDILIGYTDGVTEARSPSGKFFTEKRLRSLLDQSTLLASALLEHIKTNLFAHISNAPQFDDITMLIVQRKASD